MTQDEIDCALAAHIKASLAGRCLPDGFADRLRNSVRRSRTAFRVRIMALIALIAVALSLVVGLTWCNDAQPGRDASLMAADGGGTREKVSGWMLLSLFRECFRRNRVGKRKDED
jgi:hypothetical protein